MRPLRVLHVLGGRMDLGGIEYFLMNYFRLINKEEVIFDFLITDLGKGFFDDEIKSLGGEIYNVVSKRKKPISHLFQTVKILSKYKKMPVHLHLDGMNGLYSFLAIISGNQLRISHSHNTEHLTKNPIKLLIHNSMRLLNRKCSNRFAASSLNAHLWLHGKSRDYTWIPNAIDTERFVFNSNHRLKWRNHLNLQDEIVIGHVGRFHIQKNHSFLIKIAYELKIRGIRFKMVWVGDGELRKDLVSEINEMDLTNSIILTGKLENVNEIYNAFDMFLFPSFYEGLGIVVVEAQYNGLKCIVSDAVPKEAHISESITAIELDFEEWVRQIEDFRLQDNDLRKSGVRSEDFNIHKAVFNLANYYKGLI